MNLSSMTNKISKITDFHRSQKHLSAWLIMSVMGLAAVAFIGSCTSPKTIKMSNMEYDDYTSLWKIYDGLAKDGKYEDALEQVDIIEKKAISESNDEQILKSFFSRYAMTQVKSEDPLIDQIGYVESKIGILGTVGQQIATSYLAELYESYYSANQYRINQLTDSDAERPEEIEEWTARHLLTKISELHMTSLQNSEVLMQDLQSFNAIILYLDKGIGAELRKTVFDLLSFRAIGFYQGNFSNLIQPTYAFQFDQKEAFLSSDIFQKTSFETRDTNSSNYRLIQVFQNLERIHSSSSELVKSHILLNRLVFAYSKNTNDDKDVLYVNALEDLLKRYPNNEQSLETLNTLVEYYVNKGNTYRKDENETHKNANKKAMAILEEYGPGFTSPKGQELVAYLKKRIDKKEVSIVTEYVQIPEEDFVIKLDYKNIDKVNVKMYKIEENDLIEYYKNNKPERFFTKSNLHVEESFDITNPVDYNNHSIEIPMSGLAVGAYFCVVEDNTGMTQANNLFHVSSIGYARYDNQHLRVFDRISGLPKKATIAGFTIAWQGRKRNLEQLFEVETNEQGVHSGFPENKSIIFKVTSGDDVLFLNSQHYGRRNYTPVRQGTMLLLTDRSIYRPGQTSYFKALLYQQKEGQEPTMLVNQIVVVSLYDANRRIVESLTLKTNEFGSVHGSFELPKNLLNGQFQIRGEAGATGIRSTANIRVEEYKRPKFYIEKKDLVDRYSLDEKVTVRGKALSYTGAPITDATVSYTVTRTQPYRYYYRWFNPAPAKVISLGTSKTNDQGEYLFDFLAESDKSQKSTKNPVFNFTVEITITDQSGETRSETQYIAVGEKELLIKVAKEASFVKPDSSLLNVNVTNQNGDNVDAAIQVEISRLEDNKIAYRSRYWSAPEYQYLSQSEFGKRIPYYSYSNEHLLSNHGVVETLSTSTVDVKDGHSIDLSDLPAGVYKVVLSNKDAVAAESYITVVSERETPTNIQLDGYLKKPSYEVGETADLQIFSGANNATVYVDILRSKERLSTERIQVNGYQILSIPVSQEDKGGILVKISSSINNRFVEEDLFISVPYSEKKLNLRWETFRSELYPGSDEKWSLVISDKENKPVVAEVLTSMYDASLDQFVANQWRGLTYNHLRAQLPVNGIGYQQAHGRTTRSEKYPTRPELYIVYPQLNSQTYTGRYFGARSTSVPRGSVRSKRGDVDMLMDSAPAAPMVEADADGNMMEMNTPTADAVNIGHSNEQIPASKETETQSIRKNLNETVFFMPDLKTNSKGELVIEFTMNEALTEWKLQTLATTKSAQFVLDEQKVTTAKDLMVFPNGPRFFREGDKMSMLAKVQNKTSDDLLAKATIKFTNTMTLEDVTTKLLLESAEKSITIPAEQSTSLSWKIQVPSDMASLTYQISAETAEHKDGEENVGIVLTNRKLITESLAISLPANQTKKVAISSFDKLKNSETIEKQLLQISVTSNPSWLAVQSLPYLMEYQYNCSEQVFARFYGNKLASYILEQNPKIQSIYQQWKDKDQLISALNKNEELKSALLEQTPWVMDALSEEEQMERMATLFDLARITAETTADFNTLIERQNGGGFPWFPGQRPNWYITQYILEGLGQLDRMGVINRKEPQYQNVIQQGLRFIDAEVLADDRRRTKRYLSPIIIHFMYVRSFFPENDISEPIQELMDAYEKLGEDGWKDLGLMNQSQFALYLHRKENNDFADKIMESLSQRTLFKENLGRYWKEVNGYSWHNSNIETQAQLIVSFSEIRNNDQEVDEMKQWLLSNKQTNSWKSTKATTQAIYALIEKGEKWIQNDQLVTFKLAGNSVAIPTDNLVVATGQYDVKYRKEAIESGMKQVEFTNPNSHIAWASTSFQYWEDLDKIESYLETPLKLKRQYFKKINTNEGERLVPLEDGAKLTTGDLLTVKLALIVDRPMEYIHLQDMRAAGTEPIDVLSGYKYMGGLGCYMETRDVATNFFVDYLPRGEYALEYDQRVVQPGVYSAGISTIQSMYAPEFGANSSGMTLIVE